MDAGEDENGPAQTDERARPPTYQLALSYANADSPYVEEFAAELKKRNVSFFDPKNDVSMLGEYAPVQIQQVYDTDTQHVILFISAAYVSDIASRVEQRAAIDKANTTNGFALPARFDNTQVPGLSSSIGSVHLIDDDKQQMAPEKFAELVVDWLTKKDGGLRRAPAPLGWSQFEPTRLHCLIIGSETEASAGTGKLAVVFKRILGAEERKEVWAAAHRTIHGCETLQGPRELPTEFSLEMIEWAEVSVADAFSSDDNLSQTVRLIVEADLALFDVTHFEPAVMLLLGMRAATRRGVTIASHGADWIEGTPLDRPFNLADLSLGSHTPTGVRAGADPRVARLSKRIQRGFEQHRRHPHYHDLPVYDALRQLGSELDAWAPIPITEEVLILCTYSKEYSATWIALQDSINEALVDRKVGTEISRMQDFATPQVVSQALYEKIRRCVGCVVDWTHSSPSTFFELGVRLVVSEWGTVQIVSRTWLDRVATGSAAGDGDTGRLPPPSRQVHSMQELFAPVVYESDVGAGLGNAVAATLVKINESGPNTGHRIRMTVVEALKRVELKEPAVAVALQAAADQLDNPKRRRSNLPQTLFSECRSIKLDHEHAARERRLAAWLYLEHRLHAGQRSSGDPLRDLWTGLGEQVADELLEPGDEDDFNLGLWISDRVQKKPDSMERE